MPADPARPRMIGVILLALLAGGIAAALAAAIGVPLMLSIYPESNVAPVMAFVLLAPAAFVILYATVFMAGLYHEIPWRDAAGATVLTRLARGNAPLGIAFWVPIGLYIGVWPVTFVGGITNLFRDPLFNALVSLVNLSLAVSWIWLTWRNAGNAQNPISGRAAQGVTLLFGVLMVAALLLLVRRLQTA